MTIQLNRIKLPDPLGSWRKPVSHEEGTLDHLVQPGESHESKQHIVVLEGNYHGSFGRRHPSLVVGKGVEEGEGHNEVNNDLLDNNFPLACVF